MKTVEDWLPVVREYIEKVRSTPEGANLKNWPLCKQAVEDLQADATDAKLRDDASLPRVVSAELEDFLDDYDFVVPRSHRTFYRHIFGRQATKH